MEQQVCCALAGPGAARANSGGVCVCSGIHWASVCSTEQTRTPSQSRAGGDAGRAVKRHRGRGVEKRGPVPDEALSQEARPSLTGLGPSEVADAEAED